MKVAIFLYITLIISIILAKILGGVFYYFIPIVLSIPVIFFNIEKLGIFNFKSGIIYGFFSSTIYFPFLFLGDFDIKYLNQIPQVLLEEIFFRGYLQNIFATRFNIHISIILVSFLFAIPHIILFPSVLSALTFFPSILFGYLFFISKSIYAPFIFHLFSNLFFLIFVIDKL